MNKLPIVTFYTKPECPLCADALDEVKLARRELPFTLEVVNILSTITLYEQFRNEIPVVQINGVEIFRYRLTAAELLQALREATSHE